MSTESQPPSAEYSSPIADSPITHSPITASASDPLDIVAEHERHVAHLIAGSASRSGPDGRPGIIPDGDEARRYLHKALDAGLDFAAVMLRLAGEMTQPLRRRGGLEPSTASGGADASGDAQQVGLSVLDLPSGTPGQPVTGRLEIANTTVDWMDAISPHCDCLVGTGGATIDGHAISFAPRMVNVAPRKTQVVSMTVDVPTRAKRGRYTGLVTLAGHPNTRLLVRLDVT